MFEGKNDYKHMSYRIEAEDLKSASTLGDFLYENLGISTRQIRDFKRFKTLKVNNHKQSLDGAIRVGDVIHMIFTEEEHGITPDDIDIDVCYEDEDIVCVNKLDNIVSHPTKGHPSKTLSNAVRNYALKKGEDYKPRLINRLDRDTTGIILFGKNAHAQNYIAKQIKSEDDSANDENGIIDSTDGAKAENSKNFGCIVEKKYLSVVEGIVKDDFGTINLPIDKTEDGIKRFVSESGKQCITHFKVLKRGDNYSVLELVLETGRTHQIRVHLSHLGHCLVGDELYGADMEFARSHNITRQALHAYKITFKPPRHEIVEVSAGVPDDMRSFFDLI